MLRRITQPVQIRYHGGWEGSAPFYIWVVQAVSGERKDRMAWWPYLLCVIVLGATCVYGISIYDDLPARVATHAGFDGTPDAWGPKSVGNVFGVLMVGAGVVLLFAVIDALTVKSLSMSGWGSGARAQRSRVTTRLTGALLRYLAVVVTSCMSVMTVLGWHEIRGWAPASVLIVLMGAPMIGVVVMLWKLLRAEPSPSELDAERRSAENGSVEEASVDQDPRYWAGGIIYNNPADERVVVPKRYGLGTTINYGRPAGKTFYWGVVLLLVGSLALPFVLG